MQTLHPVIFFFCGACAGSFFYTLAVRYINGSIKANPFKALMSRSRCLSCGQSINPLHLVPFLGFALLKGKCKTCGEKIPLAYPAAEAGFGLLVLLMLSILDVSPQSIFACLLACLTLCISIIDVKTKTIPNSLAAAFAAIAIWPIVNAGTPLASAGGAVLAAAFFIIVLLIFPGAFGGGDVKLAAAIGLYSGAAQTVVVLETALIAGAIIGVVWAVASGKGRKASIPFAPFLCFGLIVSMLWGNDILLLYYSIAF